MDRYAVRRVLRSIKNPSDPSQQHPEVNHHSFATRLQAALNDFDANGYKIIDIKVGNSDAVIVAEIKSPGWRDLDEG